jgi:hypothetical protein
LKVSSRGSAIWLKALDDPLCFRWLALINPQAVGQLGQLQHLPLQRANALASLEAGQGFLSLASLSKKT